MRVIPAAEIPGLIKPSFDIEIKEDCPHGVGDNIEVVAMGDPLSGGVLFCPDCQEFTGTWSYGQPGEYEQKRSDKNQELLWELKKYFIHRFSVCSTEEIVALAEADMEDPRLARWITEIWAKRSSTPISE